MIPRQIIKSNNNTQSRYISCACRSKLSKVNRLGKASVSIAVNYSSATIKMVMGLGGKGENICSDQV